MTPLGKCRPGALETQRATFGTTSAPAASEGRSRADCDNDRAVGGYRTDIAAYWPGA